MIVERNSQESKALDMLRFPLAAFIVLLHTGYNGQTTDATAYFAKYIVGNLVVLAVPTFFFLSGYLFFMGERTFTVETYIGRIKKKVKTLLVPYLLWNLIAYIFSVIYNYAKHGCIGEMMPWDLYSIFWAQGKGILNTSVLGWTYPAIVCPAAGVLWFVRDLMCAMLLSLPMYYVIKKFRWFTIVLVLLINGLRLGVPFPGLSLAALTFFPLGSYFSIHEINIFDILKRNAASVYVLFLCLYTTKIVCSVNNIETHGILHLAMLLSGIAACFTWAWQVADNTSTLYYYINKWGGESSFFIYCFCNTLIVWFINKEIGHLLYKIPYCGCTIEYIFNFVARIIECLLVFYTMKRHCPRLLSVLVGGRIKRECV